MDVEVLAPTGRRPGDARHLLLFTGALALAVALTTMGYPWFASRLTPSPPFEIAFVDDDEAVRTWEDRDDINPERRLSHLRELYAGDPVIRDFKEPDVLWGMAIAHGGAVKEARRHAGFLGLLIGWACLSLLCRRIGYSASDAFLGMLLRLPAAYLLVLSLWRITSPVTYWNDDEPRPAIYWIRVALIIFVLYFVVIVAARLFR